jgi:rod shape-determining protein MreB
MDDAIVQYMKRKYNLLIGETTAEKVKIPDRLGVPLDKPLTMEIKGRNLIEGVPKTITVEDSEIREALSEGIRHHHERHTRGAGTHAPGAFRRY